MKAEEKKKREIDLKRPNQSRLKWKRTGGTVEKIKRRRHSNSYREGEMNAVNGLREWRGSTWRSSDDLPSIEWGIDRFSLV